MPRGIASSPDGNQIYVTNSWSDNVSVIDAAALKVVQTLPAGFEPAGVVSDRAGETLYVANRLSGDVSVIDLKSGQEIKRLLAGRGASYLAHIPRWKVGLLHAYLSEFRGFSYSAEFGNHRDRYRAADGRRTQAAAQRRGRVSPCALR